METKKSITGLTLLIFLVMIACLHVYAVQQAQGQWVVYPTNTTPDDQVNVQLAVNKGGTVLLKATDEKGNLTPFNFGAPDIWASPLLTSYDKWRVSITRDVKILGEKDNKGNPLTKIKGGLWSFYSPLPAPVLSPLPPGPDITIEGIHFDGATYAPIMIRYASGLKIVGNRLTEVHPFPTSSFFNDRIDGTRYRLRIQEGISIGLLFGVPVLYVAGALTGLIEVSDNVIDLSIDPTVYSPPYTPPPPNLPIPPHSYRNTFGEGIFASFATGASIVIWENYVKNCSRTQIEAFDNYLDVYGQGSVLIEGNTLITPQDGIANANEFCPNGITAGWVINASAPNDPAINPKYTISHNYIENISTRQGQGIVALSDGAVIQNNEIVVRGNSTNPGKNGLPLNRGLSIVSDNCYIGQNRIAGEGEYAMAFIPIITQLIPSIQYQTAGNNVCVGNNIKGFNPNEMAAHLYFGPGFVLPTGIVVPGASNNTVVGGSGTVIDNGTNNTFKGGYWNLTGSHLTTPEGVGDEISDIKDWWDLP